MDTKWLEAAIEVIKSGMANKLEKGNITPCIV